MIKTLKSLLPDAMMVSGAAAVSYGASIVYQPAGFVVAGCFLLVAGVIVAKASK